MNYYKAIIQYDGTHYFGFQWQKDLLTIQNDINLSLGQLLNGKITTMGASRTDTGVHAIEQIVKISSEDQFDCRTFLILLNDTLPSQIRCLSIAPCEGSYRPASDHASKEYRYLFSNILELNSVGQKYIVNHPYSLDLKLMNECAQMIVGRHDFKNFCSAGSNVKTTVRDILFCDISEIDPFTVLPQSGVFFLPPDIRSCYQFRIEGRGFLKQMVRHLMRALWLVGGKKITPDEFLYLLKGPAKERRLWKVAPPQGLYLYSFKHFP